MEAVKKFISDLPSWAKGVVAVAVIAGVSVVGYRVWKGAKNAAALKGAKAENDAIDDELKKEPKAQSRPNSEIQEMANSLHTAMSGYGTDIPRIYQVTAKIRNNSDALALKKAYGIRTLSSGRWSPEPDFTGTLSQAFSEELSDAQIMAINKELSKKGITSRF
jgi:hypothetical protein